VPLVQRSPPGNNRTRGLELPAATANLFLNVR